MNLPITVNQEGLLDILLNIAPVRPVFIWGAPGIGKSALVEEFSIEGTKKPCIEFAEKQRGINLRGKPDEQQRTKDSGHE